MDEKFQEIIGKVFAVFMKYGVKSPNMDTIARELKMSKKTLYKYVKDKSELVQLVMGFVCQAEETQLSEIRKANDNAIDETIAIARNVVARLQTIHPSVHYDLERYYPEAFARFDQHKTEFIYECVIDTLQRGIKQGYFRDNMNPEIVARIYIQKLDMIFDPSVFPMTRGGFEEIYLELMRYHIRGIATQKGIDYLVEKLSNDNLTLY